MNPIRTCVSGVGGGGMNMCERGGGGGHESRYVCVCEVGGGSMNPITMGVRGGGGHACVCVRFSCGTDGKQCVTTYMYVA